MTFKRRLLSALCKEDLLAIGREHELDVTARLTIDELRDVVARSKRATVEKIVGDGMSRDTLKAICEACGLDSSGKEKQPIVDRILAAAKGEPNGNDEYEIDPAGAPGSTARDGAAFALTSPMFTPKKASSRAAPRSPSTGARDDIAAYQHDDKRKNNPPAGLLEFDKPPAQPTRTYAYDPHLDPQLVWAGKAEHTSFEVDTVSLHIHERVSPEAILRAVKREDVQGDLFARFELPESKAIDFYQHDVGWANRMILGDSLLVMNSLLEREQMAGKIQMIYVDPPYGVKFNSNFQPMISRRDVKEDDASLTREPEQIQAYRDTWTLGVHSYLTYMRDRLHLARELLAGSGSIFVQISDENLHHVREMLDEIFGKEQFLAAIAFKKTGGLERKGLSLTFDYLLWYAKSKEDVKFRPLFVERDDQDAFRYVLLSTGETSTLADLGVSRDRLPPGAKLFQSVSLTSQGTSANRSGPFTYKGRRYVPPPNRHWSVDLKRVAESGRIMVVGDALRYIYLLEDYPIAPLSNVWADTGTGSFTEPQRYVVETATKVVQRCVLMSTDPGDLVLDPTCGSGTTAYVAEQWGRRWITCDTSRVALALARQRVMTARFPYYRLRSRSTRDGFILETAPHIKPSAVAENTRLDSCATRAERDRVIRESAEQEVLHDKPSIDSARVRVAGPFTVEAIPIAALDPDEAPDAGPSSTDSEQSAADYLGMMIDLLKRSGVQFPNNRHLALGALRPVRGPYEYLHAEAEVPNGTTKRVAVSFGSRHAPVTPVQVLTGINETRGYDMVVFVGFACDPEARRIIDAGVHGRELQFANAAPDILVGDLLKTKKTTRLFTTFGAPDVRVEPTEDEGIKLTLAGVDLYDPNTGETHHRSGEDVAAWFIDHDYDGRTFCICQALFPGGGKNPWEKLQKALKGTIDEDKFETLRTATSLPFKPGKKVAVKVIDDRGNEVIKLVDPKPSRRKGAS